MNNKLYFPIGLVILLVVTLLFLAVYSEDNQISGASGSVDTEDKGGLGGPSTPEEMDAYLATHPQQSNQNTNTLQSSEPGETSFTQHAATGVSSYRSKSELSNLFFESNEKADYRESVDRFFAQNYLGVEYYESAICAQWYPITSQGLAKVEMPSGAIQFIGHVEGDRSEAMPLACTMAQECRDALHSTEATCRNGVCQLNNQLLMRYFYKLSGSVRAPYDEKMTQDKGGEISFNIILKDENNEPVAIFLEYITLKVGETHKLALPPFYSARKYDQVCIWFGEKPKTVTRVPIGQGAIPFASFRGGGEELVDEICNQLPESERSFTNAQNNPGQAPPSTVNVNPNI